jgi:hypothetical protein
VQTSGPSHLNGRVSMLEFNAGIIGRELPIGLGVVFVTLSLPGSDLFFKLLFVGNALGEAL